MNNYIKYNEIFTVNRGILKYSEISIENYSEMELNILCLANFGSFILSPIIMLFIENNSITESALQQLGLLIKNKFYNNWQRYLNVLNTEYNLEENALNIKNYTQNVDNFSSDTTITNENNDIYGFNSEISTPDNKSTTDLKSNRNGNIKTNYSSFEKSKYDALKIQQAIDNEIKLREKVLIDYIIKDLKNFATLSICL